MKGVRKGDRGEEVKKARKEEDRKWNQRKVKK